MYFIHELKDIFSYLTTWNLTLLSLFSLGYFQNYYYDLLFLSIYISCCSFIFTYIEPKKIKFKVGNLVNYTFKGKELIIFDLIFHHIPLVMIYNLYKYKYKCKTYLFVIIPLIYKLMLNDNYERYGLKDKIIFPIYFFIFIFYFFIID